MAAEPAPRVLAVTTVDVMPWVLLRPWLRALREAGYEVHVACSRGEYFDQLAAEGFQMHAVALQRSFNPFVHLRPLLQLYRLIRRGGFSVVNTHSPVAAAVGRLAARAAGGTKVVYTVHGFYFHDHMPRLWRRLFIVLEWLIGQITDHFMFVSEEDRQTALQTGIAPSQARTSTIYNGIDLAAFSPERAGRRAPEDHCVVGIVGRIVKEKGYREFFQMAREIWSAGRDVTFLVVGDSLPSDRDPYGETLRRRVEQEGMASAFVFTGFTAEVPRHLRMMDIFVLPSYREGFPRSVLEAMGTGLPVVATDIRGCREAVVDGETGLIVPPRHARALTEAVLFLVDNPEEAARMGAAGRRRVVERYDERMVQQKFVGVFRELLNDPKRKEACGTSAGNP